MTVEELSDYLRVNKKTIYRLLDQNKIPALRIGHQWRFDRAVIDDWLNQNSLNEGATILVIDDEEVIRVLFREILEKLRHEVITVQDGFQGLELIKRIDFDMVFLDLKMQGIDGVEVFRNIKSLKPDLPVIIITGYPDSDLMTQALAHGPFGIMKKPFGEADIISAVNSFSKPRRTSKTKKQRGN